MGFGDKKRLRESIGAGIIVMHSVIEREGGIDFPVEAFFLDSATQNALRVFKAGYSVEEAGDIGQATYLRLLIEKYPNLAGGPFEERGNELMEKHLSIVQEVFG